MASSGLEGSSLGQTQAAHCHLILQCQAPKEQQFLFSERTIQNGLIDDILLIK